MLDITKDDAFCMKRDNDFADDTEKYPTLMARIDVGFAPDEGGKTGLAIECRFSNAVLAAYPQLEPLQELFCDKINEAFVLGLTRERDAK